MITQEVVSESADRKLQAPGFSLSKVFLQHFSVVLIAAAVFLIQAPSYVFHPFDHLPDGGDAILNSWILAWNAQAITHLGTNVWNAPIYYPVSNVLAFSETMFGNLWVTFPVQMLTGNHVLAANALLFASFVLGMYTTFLLVASWTKCFWAGVIAGIIFSFNPYRWSEAHHLQLMPFFYAPLALLCWHRFLEMRQTRMLAGAVLTLTAQTYASVYLGIILFVMLLVYTSAYFVGTRAALRADAKQLLTDRRLLVAGIIVAFAMLPIGVPYLAAADDWSFSRSESENATFSAEPLSLVLPNNYFASYQGLYSPPADRIRGSYGLGIVPWLFASIGVCVARRDRIRSCILWTGLGMLVLMFGPYLIWMNHKTDMPLPYLLVYHVLPGAKAMRVPARFIFPLLLCLAVLSGFAVSALLTSWRHWRPRWKVAVALAGGLLICIDYAVADDPGFKLDRREQFPPVYDYLAATRPNEPVLELPAKVREQFGYLHYQTAHWRPLLGGESGCYTPAVLETARRTEGRPTDELIRFIQLSPAATVVVHLDKLDPPTAAAWQQHDLEPFGFAFMGRFGHAMVWERIGLQIATSPKLRLEKVTIEPRRRFLSDSWHVEATATPADQGKPWSYLSFGTAQLEIRLIGVEGDEHHYLRNVAVPAYLLAGESAKITIGKLRGGPKEVREIRLRGPNFVDYENQ